MSLLEKKTKIWKDGQTTIPFVCPQTSFSKSRRFKLYSIYWPEKNYSAGLIKQTRTPIDLQAYRISKLIDDQEKNQSRMAKMPGRKSQDKASSLSQPRNGFSKFIPTRLQSLSRKNQQIVFRLTSASQMSQSKLRDRHGNRANVYENQQQDLVFSTLKEQRKYRGTQKGFCTSRRINLNLPHNYYPGPGTYQIKRYLQQKNRLRNQMIKRQKGDNIQNDN